LPVKPKEAPVGMLVAPIVLAAMVIVIFFIPNIVGDMLVIPAVVAMQDGLYSSPSGVLVQVLAWHGLLPVYWMKIGMITLGILLFATLKRWRNVYDLQPNALSLNAAYDGIMTFGETTMNRLSRLFMTGILRTYLIYMFIAIVAIVLTTLFVKDAFSIHF